MQKQTSGKTVSTILFTSVAIILIGIIFQVQHYPYGKLLTYLGASLYLILSLFEMERLKKIISALEKDDENGQ